MGLLTPQLAVKTPNGRAFRATKVTGRFRSFLIPTAHTDMRFAAYFPGILPDPTPHIEHIGPLFQIGRCEINIRGESFAFEPHLVYDHLEGWGKLRSENARWAHDGALFPMPSQKMKYALCLLRVEVRRTMQIHPQAMGDQVKSTSRHRS